MYIRAFILCLLVTAQLPSRAAADDLVYTWVDGDGVTHFSDAPPVKAAAPGNVETMSMPTGFPDAADANEDYYSITNQWQRIQEERTARQEFTLERKRLRIEEARMERDEAMASASKSGNERPTVVYGGGFYHSQLPAFAHNSRVFFGNRGIKPGFGRKGHHKSAHRPVDRVGQRQQNKVGNHSTVNEPRTGTSPAVTHRLGSAGK
ncbi:MAG: DUF4124 domain-containing protein [Gammaproteobacteria bacterium]